MAKSKYYSLTETATQDFRNAKKWSLNRWGATLTKGYFSDLHKAAEYVAKNLSNVQKRDDLTGDLGLRVHAVREHYMVYLPVSKSEIVIVALIRQSRNVPEILKANAFQLRRELQDIDRTTP